MRMTDPGFGIALMHILTTEVRKYGRENTFSKKQTVNIATYWIEDIPYAIKKVLLYG